MTAFERTMTGRILPSSVPLLAFPERLRRGLHHHAVAGQRQVVLTIPSGGMEATAHSAPKPPPQSSSGTVIPGVIFHFPWQKGGQPGAP
jgi:hypothetical protein